MDSGQDRPLEPSKLSDGPCSPEDSSTSCPSETSSTNPSTPPSSDTGKRSTGFGKLEWEKELEHMFAELASYEKKREADCTPPSSSASGKKKFNNGFFKMNTVKGRAKFATWLKNIPDANYFLDHEQRMVFLTRMSLRCRRLVKNWLRRVDPVGLSQLKGKLWTISHATSKKKDLSKIIEQEQTDMIMMEKKVLESPGMSIIQVVPKTGIQLIVSSLIIAGKSREEVGAIMQMPVADVNSMVAGLDLSNSQAVMNDAIQAMANGMVAVDLATKQITQQTIEANKIAVSRRKLQLDESAEVRELRKENTHALEAKAIDAESRFLNVEEVKE